MTKAPPGMRTNAESELEGPERRSEQAERKNGSARRVRRGIERGMDQEEGS
jgi:hypothetical protein